MSLMFCFLCNPQAMELALTREDRATNNHTLLFQDSWLLNLLSGSMSESLSLHDLLLLLPPFQIMWVIVPRIPEPT
jgi:hypothetical protein